MQRGRDRADGLARRVLALGAEHRLEEDVRARGVADEVTVEPQPVHVAVAPDLVLADDREVVLRLAGDDAAAAAGAGVEVDDHLPLRGGRFQRGPEALYLNLLVPCRRARVARGDLPHDRPPVRLPGRLHEGELHVVSRLLDARREARGLEAGGGEPGGTISVAARVSAVAVQPAVADGNADDPRVLARLDSGREDDGPPARLHPHDVAVDEAERQRPLRSHPDARRPGDPRQRIGQLPQPRDVRPRAVAQTRLGDQLDLDLGRLFRDSRGGGGERRQRLGRKGSVRLRRHRLESGCRIRSLRSHPPLYGVRPAGLEIQRCSEPFPPALDEVRPPVGGALSGPVQEILPGRARVEERADRRLGQRHVPGPRLGVGPRLEAVVRGGDDTARGSGRGGAIRDGHRERKALQRRGQLLAAGQLVDRVEADDEEGVHRPVVDRLKERGQLAIEAPSYERGPIEVERLPLVAEEAVQESYGDLFAGIVGTAHDERAAAGREELRREGSRPRRGSDRIPERLADRGRRRTAGGEGNLPQNRECQLAPLGGGEDPALVGRGPRERERTFDLHVSEGAPRLVPSPGGPRPRMPDRVPPGAEKVGAERDEEVRLLELEERKARRAGDERGGRKERRHGPGLEVVLDELPAERSEEGADRLSRRRADDRRREDGHAPARRGAERGEPLAHVRVEGGPGSRLPGQPRSLEPSGVVEPAQVGLAERTKAATGEGVLRIPFQLDGTAGEVRGEDAAGSGTGRTGRGVVNRDARYGLFRRNEVRNRLLHRKPLARCQRRGGADPEGLQEVAAAGEGTTFSGGSLRPLGLGLRGRFREVGRLDPGTARLVHGSLSGGRPRSRSTCLHASSAPAPEARADRRAPSAGRSVRRRPRAPELPASFAGDTRGTSPSSRGRPA